MKRRSSRLHRRRRFKVRRRTLKGRRTRSGRSRRSRFRRSGRSLAVPTRSRKEFSYIYSFQSGTNRGRQNIWYLASANHQGLAPADAFLTMFKEFRIVDCLVAVRRRYPEPVLYQPNSQEQTVAASRLTTNNIWWCPWAKSDPPEYGPRKIKSAILLSSRWSVRRIKQYFPVVQWYFSGHDSISLTASPGLEYGGGVSLNNLILNASPQAVAYRRMYARPKWGRQPWQTSFSQPETSDPAPRTGSCQITMGFFLVENASIVPDDDIEMRVRVTYAHKGRKNLAGYQEDRTGAFTSVPRMVSFDLDSLGTAPKASFLQESILLQESDPTRLETPDIIASS